MTCNHEWGGAVIPGPVNRIVIDQCENCGELRLPDAAPPAQAVDLGAVRKCADEAVEFINHGYGGHARRKIQELLTLIDSQAVGK